MKVVFNFGGFYGSHFEVEIDNALEDENTDNLDFKIIHLEVSKHITTRFNEFVNDEYGTDVAFKFDSLDSPRYYNYVTDTITLEISKEDLVKLDELVANDTNIKDKLEHIVKNVTTSCHGYIPFFDYDKVMGKIDEDNSEVYYQCLLDALRTLDEDEYFNKTLDALSESVFASM